ncbi:MAG TPA: hypothetical protein PLU30_11090 [Verrucomicrobiae bacterium]|nr:hypothetical protein [Verrucomicrobiae bacterium]
MRFLAVAALLTVAGACLAETGGTARGVELARRGEWSAAREALLSALQENPTDPVAVRELAEIARSMGDMTGCIRYWERLVELLPEDAAARFDLANLYFFFREATAKVRGVPEGAVISLAQAQYRMARRLAPDEYRFAAALAESFVALEEPEWNLAEEAWRYCLPLASDKSAVYCKLARVCIEAGALDRAEEYLRNARGVRAAELRAELARRREASSVSVAASGGRDS